MTIEDKTFLLGICQMPRLGLTPQQIGEIERVIDGRECGGLPTLAVTYEEAARMLGYTSKWSTKTIQKFVKEGRLVKSAPGRVTLESVKSFGGEVAA